MNKLITSVSYSDEEIINNILKLHVKNNIIDCDPTYSIGNFYNKTNIQPPKYKFDINPQVDGVEYADARNLPLRNDSINCLMFDPPFLATTGKSLEQSGGGNIINKRFGVYPNEKILHKFYIDSMKEFYRVLNKDGILIFKCQDKVSSGKQYMSHVFIMNQAINIGFYPKDLFILIAKNRIIANWQLKNQKHARKYHSYYWVFQKTNKLVEYTSEDNDDE